MSGNNFLFMRFYFGRDAQMLPPALSLLMLEFSNVHQLTLLMSSLVKLGLPNKYTVLAANKAQNPCGECLDNHRHNKLIARLNRDLKIDRYCNIGPSTMKYTNQVLN